MAAFLMPHPKLLQNVLCEIFVFDQFAQAFFDKGRVDGDGFAAVFVRLVGDFFEQLFHHGMQAARADVFGAFVDLTSHFGQTLNTRIGEFERDVLDRHQRGVLARQTGIRTG